MTASRPTHPDHMSLRFDRTFRTGKVATITPVFWGLKVLTTAMGEATSDYFVNRFNSVAAVLCTGVVFAVVLWWQLRAPRYAAVTYWSAVVMVSVFGTMCADVVHVALHVPYVVSVVGFGVGLIVVFASWRNVEGTLSIHSITTTRRELFYWTTVTATFALGTALGDMCATTLHLGYFGSGFLFAGLISLPLLYFAVLRRHAILMFWSAYVVTRPLGASFADAMGKPRVAGGLGWGPGNVALALSAMIVVGVTLVALRERPDRVG
jgi:uncharacterized membrane-anchored protein